MIRERQPRRERERKIVHRPAFRRRQRRRPDVISRCGAHNAEGEFILPRLLPSGRILQIEVDTADIRLPARGKRHVGVALRDAHRRIVVLAARELARHKIDAVRVDARRYVDARRFKKLPRALPENFAVFSICARKLLGKFEQHGDGYPLVGVVRGVMENAPFAVAEREIPQRPSHDRAADPPGFDKRISRRDPAHAKRHERRSKSYVCGHNIKRERDHETAADSQIFGRDAGICRKHRRQRHIVLPRERKQRVTAMDSVLGKACVVRRERSVRRRSRDAVCRKPVVGLKNAQRSLCGASENAVDNKRLRPRAPERQLQKLDRRPDRAIF